MADDSSKTDPNFNSGDNAAITAFWICGCRALEFRKGEDALIKDPYAERLMANGGWEHFEKRSNGISSKMNLPRLSNTVINRTMYYDSKILKGAKELGIRQVVIIGAGLDTRAFRLFQDYPDMHVIEVDHPNLFAYKEPRLKDLQPLCKRSLVKLQYNEVEDWDIHAQRDEFGFDPSKPTIFVIEGLTMYIPLPDELKLYKKIDSNAAINSMIVGCSQRIYGGVRDLGYGITWYDTDRNAMKEVLKCWGISLKSTHRVNIGISMMMVGIKREEPYEAEMSFLEKYFPFIRFD